jgi:mono/diheme cytochrome c family protein
VGRRQIQITLVVIGAAATVSLQSLAAAAPDGKQLYADACATCHGSDGRGAPLGTGIQVPLPDFADCQVSTVEADADWGALVAHGGPYLGLSAQMPAFGDVLTPEEISAVLDYVRTFCASPLWPRGELNFRRPVFVTKAFPENEAVLSESFADQASERIGITEVSVEKRIGPRGQLELAIPFPVRDRTGDGSVGGIGDVTIAYKYTLYASLPAGSIVSVGTDVVLPSGSYSRGLGDGTTTFEPALLTGHTRWGLVLQTQFNAVVPLDVDRAPRAFLYRFALQYPLGPLKRALVPALEFEAGQRIAGNFRGYTSLGPTLYVPLSRRGHVALGLGGLLPVTHRAPFDYQLGAFFLWEYFDGGIWW